MFGFSYISGTPSTLGRVFQDGWRRKERKMKKDGAHMYLNLLIPI